VFVAPGACEVMVGALERRGLAAVRVGGADVACVMAAVSGALDAIPGAAVIGGETASATAGLAYARAARSPAVVIGVGPSASASVSATETKAELTVTPASAAHWIAHACQLAMKEPWGAVRLHLPSALAALPALPTATSPRPAPLPPPDPRALDAAVRLLAAAERPVVVAGRWCRSESDATWIRAFAEARPAPVLATAGARGVVPDPHPLLIGILDGGEPERQLLASADLVVAVGVDPDETSGGAWSGTSRALELTPVAPESRSDDRLAVVGDIGLTLEELAPRLRDVRSAEWDVARLHAWKQAAWTPPAAARDLARYRIVDMVRSLTPPGTVAVFEHGPLWPHAARAWRAVAPSECLMSTGASVEGFAPVVAAAVGLVRAGRPVVCFADASTARRAPASLAAAAALAVPVLIVLSGDDAASTLPPGLRHASVRWGADFARAFDDLLGAGGPAVLAVGGLP
jgi:thiamine pyrophosphate-dependent acetolactate synthase large subunit-like protein